MSVDLEKKEFYEQSSQDVVGAYNSNAPHVLFRLFPCLLASADLLE
jgi:hypothetical protein